MARQGLVRTVKRVRGRGGKTVSRTYWTSPDTVKASRVGGAAFGAVVGGYAGSRAGQHAAISVGARMIVHGQKRNSNAWQLAGLGVAASGKAVGAISGALVGGIGGHAAGRAIATRATRPRTQSSFKISPNAVRTASAISGGIAGAHAGYKVGGVLGSLSAIPATTLASYAAQRMGIRFEQRDTRRLFGILHHTSAAAGGIAGARIGYGLGQKHRAVGAASAVYTGAVAVHAANKSIRNYLTRRSARVYGANPVPSYKTTHGAASRSFAGSFPSAAGVKRTGAAFYRSVVGGANRRFGRADRMLGG